MGTTPRDFKKLSNPELDEFSFLYWGCNQEWRELGGTFSEWHPWSWLGRESKEHYARVGVHMDKVRRLGHADKLACNAAFRLQGAYGSNIPVEDVGVIAATIQLQGASAWSIIASAYNINGLSDVGDDGYIANTIKFVLNMWKERNLPL